MSKLVPSLLQAIILEWMVSCCIAVGINKFTLYPQSVNTAIGSPTSASTDSTLPCIGLYFESTVNPVIKVAAFMTENRNAPSSLNIFLTNGSTVSSVSFTSGADVLVFKDPLKLLIGRNTVSYLLYTMQCTGVSCLLNPPAPPNNNPVTNTINYVRQAAEGSTSNYIILGGTNYQRYDIYNGFLSSPVATYPDLGYSCLALYLINNNNYIVQTNSRASIPVLFRDSFAILKILSISRSEIYGSAMNNLRDNNYYQAGPGFVDDLDLLSSNSQISASVSRSLTMTYNPLKKNMLINFGPYLFVGVLAEQNFMVMIYKSNLTIAADPSLNQLGSDPAAERSLVGTQVSSSLVYIYFMATNNRNFQSFGMLLERCLSRDASGVCSQCYTGHYRNSSKTGNICLLPSEFPPKLGINEANKLMSPCLEQGCYNCLTNYTVCVQCDWDSNNYLFGGVCSPLSTAPEGYGLDTNTKMIDLCTDTNCHLCQADRSICTSCLRVTRTYLRNGNCQTIDTLPLGFGVENATYTANLCKDTNCDFCRYDYTFCTSCTDNEPPLVLYNGTCYKNYEMPTGVGQDKDDYTGRVCSTVNCVNCSIDYLECKGCNRSESNLGVMDNACVYCDPKELMATVGEECTKICENPSCMLLLVGSRYNYHKTTATVKFSKYVSIASLNLLTVMLSDPWTNTNITMTNSTMDMSMKGDSIMIKLSINDARYMGQLIINPIKKDDTPLKTAEAAGELSKPFLNFPIEVDSIFGYSSTGTNVFNSMSQVSFEATRFVRTISTFILVTQGTLVSIMPAQLSSNILYLKLINGQAMMYPTMMFEYYVEDPQLPIVMLTNPFDSMTSESNCTIPPRFFERELGCNILTNFGVGTIIIFATLLINIAISAAFYVSYTVRINVHKSREDEEKIKELRKSKGYRVMAWMTKYFGIRFFRIRMEGIAIELVCYSMINILSEFEQVALTFGAILSYVYIALYLISNIYTYMTIREIYPKLKEQQDLLKNANEAYIFPPTTTVNQVVNYHDLKYGHYDLFLMEYKANINPLLLYTPFIVLIRLMLIILCLFCFSRSGIIQVFCTISIEIAYTVFLFKSDVRVNKYEHLLMLFTQAGYIIYNFLSLLTYLPVGQNSKQLYIGFSMAAVIIAVTYVTLIYVSIIFVYKCIYAPIQWLYYKNHATAIRTGRKNKKQNQVIWGESAPPVKEEVKTMTVKDVLLKKQDQELRHEQRMMLKRGNSGVGQDSMWKGGYDADESVNLKDAKPAGKLNEIHPFTKKTTLKMPDEPDIKDDQQEDIDDNVSAKNSNRSATQNTASHALKKNLRYKKHIMKNTLEKPELAPQKAGMYTFSRNKKKDV